MRHVVARVGLGDRLEQRLGVRVTWICVDLGRRADLDDSPEVHDRYAVAEVSCGREVMSDVEIGKAEIALQVPHQLENLGAYAHVEHRDRLIGDDELRSKDDGAG